MSFNVYEIRSDGTAVITTYSTVNFGMVVTSVVHATVEVTDSRTGFYGCIRFRDDAGVRRVSAPVSHNRMEQIGGSLTSISRIEN